MHCSDCHRELAPSEPVYYIRQDAHCRVCTLATIDSWRKHGYWPEDAGTPHERPCRHCGRPIGSIAVQGVRRYCSDDCRAAAYNERRRRQDSHTLLCQHCGESFTAKRSDAQYCPNKCRMAAHRATKGTLPQ